MEHGFTWTRVDVQLSASGRLFPLTLLAFALPLSATWRCSQTSVFTTSDVENRGSWPTELLEDII